MKRRNLPPKDWPPEAKVDRGVTPAIEVTSEQAVQILRDAAMQREALAAQALSAAQVNTMLSSLSVTLRGRVGQLRREGRLLGVYITYPTPSYRYPRWQFHPDGHPADHLAETLGILRDFGPFQREPHGLRRTTGWGELEWFLSPHVLLAGLPPAEVLLTDPRRVLHAARVEFEASN